MILSALSRLLSKNIGAARLPASLSLVSVHVPKTAGTSFRQVLRNLHGQEGVVRVDIPLTGSGCRINERPYEGKNLPTGIRVVHGHFCPADIMARFPETERAAFITWLRDPVERVISNYYYLEKRLREELDEKGKNLDILTKMQRSLLEYASADVNRNRQHTFMRGKELEDFSFVGILEKYEEDIQALSRKFGWPTPRVVKVNVTGRRPEVSPALREEIARLNALDVALYQRALHLRARRNAPPRVEIISLHLPKTAGTSFYRTLREVFGGQVGLPYRRENVREAKERYGSLANSLDGRLRVVHGHFYYSEIADLRLKHRAHLITWLRDPVDRVISNYRFFKAGLSSPQRNPADYRVNRHRAGETIQTYADREDTRNVMSKFLAGADLDDFYFVGIQEHYAADLERLRKKLDWPATTPHHLNVSIATGDDPDFTDPELRQFIADRNREDIALYRAALLRRQQECNEELQ